MADIVIIGGDYEATRKFLVQASKQEPGLYKLMKDTEFIDEGDRIVYSCGIYMINAVICVNEKGEYAPTFIIMGRPNGRSELNGLDTVLEEVEKPSGGSIEILAGHPTERTGSMTVQVIFDPTSPSLENKDAFAYNLEEFRRYMESSLSTAIDSNATWNVPRREFSFQSGVLSLALPLDPQKKK